jgi:hypothetical protein
MSFTNEFKLSGTGAPLGSDPANNIDGYILDGTKKAMNERLALEHNDLATGGTEPTISGAQGRHIPGAVGVLYYGTKATFPSNTTGGQIFYATDVPNVGFYHSIAGAWTPLAISTDEYLADGETLEIFVGSPSTLGMKHDNQQWTTTYDLQGDIVGTGVFTDCNKSNSFKVTLGVNSVLENPDALSQKAGATYVWIITQDGTGGRTLTYGTAFKWAGGVAPVLSTDPAAVDIITAISDGTNLYASVLYDFSS